MTGYGTGGTVTGLARVLRKERPETRIILSEPANAQLVGSGVAQQRGADGGARRQPPDVSSRIRFRAGRRISSRRCCRNASTAAAMTS